MERPDEQQEHIDEKQEYQRTLGQGQHGLCHLLRDALVGEQLGNYWGTAEDRKITAVVGAVRTSA